MLRLVDLQASLITTTINLQMRAWITLIAAEACISTLDMAYRGRCSHIGSKDRPRLYFLQALKMMHPWRDLLSFSFLCRE